MIDMEGIANAREWRIHATILPIYQVKLVNIVQNEDVFEWIL